MITRDQRLTITRCYARSEAAKRPKNDGVYAGYYIQDVEDLLVIIDALTKQQSMLVDATETLVNAVTIANDKLMIRLAEIEFKKIEEK